ncbi:hypothetical protein [Lysobacter gummosus]|uniref:hypothetical protein n=1 Tax=Lysobacter gummosus TaxID=262324 RepID=UPI003638228B
MRHARLEPGIHDGGVEFLAAARGARVLARPVAAGDRTHPLLLADCGCFLPDPPLPARRIAASYRL